MSAIMSSLSFAVTHALASQVSSRPPAQLRTKPPQLDPEPEAGAGCLPEEEPVPSSPTCSEAAADIYHDCFSEVPSCGASSDDRQHGHSSSGEHELSLRLQGQLQAERRQRQCAEEAAAELQAQLEDICAVLFPGASSSSSSSDTAGQAAGEAAGAGSCCSGAQASCDLAVLPAAVAELLKEHRAQSEALARCREEREAECAAARLAAAACAQAAAAADLQEQWDEERESLQRRLEQSARMVEAMLKHSKENPKAPEDTWKAQLVNCAVSAGCLALGAAAAGLIITRMGAGAAAGR